MFFAEFLVAALLGTLLGILCGLIPGLHTNTVTALTFSLSPVLLEHVSVLALVIFITAMGVCQETLNCIPATFLGAPDTDTALSVLPAHEMLMKGKGIEAVMVNTAGSLLALFSSLTFALPFVYMAKLFYPLIKPLIGYLILTISIVLIFKSSNKLKSFLIFAMSGLLGFIVLNQTVVSEPLLPLFSGLFGVSLLLYSIKTITDIPKQKFTRLNIEKSYAKSLVLVSVAGWMCAFLPGLGPSQAAALTESLAKFDRKKFIFLVGGLSSANFVISFTTLFAINKARNGAVVTISRLLQSLDIVSLMIIFSVCLIVGCVAAMVTISSAKGIAKLFTRLNYKALCYSVIVFIIALVLLLNGFIGILILVTSTFLGLTANILEVKKSMMMGCLLVPVMLYFLL